LLLFAFVTFCEGYIGILPTLELWGQLFYLKLGTRVKGEPARCGACITVQRSGTSGIYFPKTALPKSVKKWQDTYFYVRNIYPDSDCLNLPAYVAGPSAGERDNWGQRPRPVPAVITNILSRLQELVNVGGLKASDLLAAFIHRRICPLQTRPHRICDMTGRRDPCRLLMKRLPTKEVVRHVNDISNSKLDEESWEFGMPPYSRIRPSPEVSLWSPYFAHAILLLRPDHPSADQLYLE
jgi:hypothetical protein